MLVIITSGNHDAAVGLLEHLAPRDGLTVITAGEPAVIEIEGGGIDIVTAGVTGDPDPRRIIHRFPAPRKNSTTIGMLHTSLTGEHSRSVRLPTTK
ncbi:hypothetical protein ACFSSC_09960 [Corynebacterium mendelii]|uniref:Uncharacterized protein n=1 Tax=Corynebacterium mendelii TaxID=2765362 RepID=A0A939E280_9CORY|nr:hypothetical protein [Corynebacterium mendelii]MBN9644433.1 hypothetical protein [Corynebacterium mendelii]